MKHVSERIHIKGIAFLVHLESDVMLLIGNCSPKFLHVDGRDTCSDQEGWIKRSERENIQIDLKGRSESENIQSNLKGGFLGLECGAQSVVATTNRKTLFPWNKSIVQRRKITVDRVTANSDGNVYCEFGHTMILLIRALKVSANSDTKDYLRIRILRRSANSCPTSNCKFGGY
ncbi:hypothetical protein Tco_0499136 [Tanacetum coccineum]